MKQTRFLCLLALACFSAAIATNAQPERALPSGTRPEDARLGPLTLCYEMTVVLFLFVMQE
jgi:hypothetical protein